MEFINEVLEQIWKDRYQKNNETFSENLNRVSEYCGSNDREKKEFNFVMDSGRFFPAGRTMSNSGIGKSLTMNNCFVAPQIQDSLTDIFDKVSLGARVHQRGGGIGYDFSQLRPKGTPTSNDAIASGAISFMDVFNAQTATILQGNRRGANMGVLNVYNMDIEDFINAKATDANKLNHFNISVMVDDDFMIAVKKDKNIFLRYPVYDETGKIIKNEFQWKIKKEISARYLWNKILKMAYENGEPGIFFYDNMNKDNNLKYIENIVGSNPCAEYLAGTVYGKNPITGERIISSEYGGACNLGSLFLHNFVENPFTSSAEISYDKLERAIEIAVNFLDNIIDINNFPDPIFANYQKSFRTIGLGITGLADLLVMMGLKYDSYEAKEVTDNLMNFISYHAYMASIELAKEKGSFPFFVNSEFCESNFLKKHVAKDRKWLNVIDGIKRFGIRNAKILSIAPTGTLSLTFGNNCSSGIEPIFCLEYDRKVNMGGQQEKHEKIIPMEDYAWHVWKNTPPEINIVSKDCFVTALNIDVKAHIDMLSVIAFHTDMSVSKTINVPESYTLEQAKDIYFDCWEAGIKGCTIFRPNAIRQGILMEKKSEEPKKEVEEENIELPRGFIVEVPSDLSYRKYKLATGCGTLYFFLGIDEFDGTIYDCFTNTDGVGGCSINTQANSRLLSLCLRGGIPMAKIIDQLNKSGTCPSFQYQRGKGKVLAPGKSCPSSIAFILKKVWDEMEKNRLEEIEEETAVTADRVIEKEFAGKLVEVTSTKPLCPECNSTLVNEGGCITCKQCGFSKCG